MSAQIYSTAKIHPQETLAQLLTTATPNESNPRGSTKKNHRINKKHRRERAANSRKCSMMKPESALQRTHTVTEAREIERPTAPNGTDLDGGGDAKDARRIYGSVAHLRITEGGGEKP
jgi:hypothetical protein